MGTEHKQAKVNFDECVLGSSAHEEHLTPGCVGYTGLLKKEKLHVVGKV